MKKPSEQLIEKSEWITAQEPDRHIWYITQRGYEARYPNGKSEPLPANYFSNKKRTTR